MSSFNLSKIGELLEDTSQKSVSTGVSFAGKSLKLNSENDGKEVVDAIKNCIKLEYLDLEGNTLGPEAAKTIAKCLEEHGSNLKRALWKDMFTGRMKDEIPLALEYLGNGLCTAGTKLVELDLSDNAFGPIGVKGLATLLSSSSCYSLQELRLNNNGLGISGAKMLAQALHDCYSKSVKAGSPLALKVFIAGRNRLENEGATALASVFKQLKSLEEIVIPQNGIYHAGISALAEGLSANLGLRILNLNDNTVGPKGAQALARILPNLKCLENINLGDCLLKTKGAIVLTQALGDDGSYPALTELNLSYNEIRSNGIDPIVQAVAHKAQLTSLLLDGNFFGSEGRESLKEGLSAWGRLESLGTLEEDATDDETENTDEESDEDDDDDDDDVGDENIKIQKDVKAGIIQSPANKDAKKPITIPEFLNSPSGENLLILKQHGNKAQDFIDHAKCTVDKQNQDTSFSEELLRIIMKVSSLCGSGFMDVRIYAESLSDELYLALFSHAIKTNQIHVLNNNLLVNLGLLKGENKDSEKINVNLEGCFKALEIISQRNYFLSQTKETLKLFIDKPMKKGRSQVIDPLQDVKMSLKTALERISIV
ncbi:ran GTPase-activating protein 1 [Leptopilina boulardi]|uniref:ran GTPase-activating protein 1 n=1 Tax=Leptopilina boulardi TaxID=63433 RepID=UPI0021F5D417|nr:ran GTPase-activating protein 1 [Leptopilina boulardi]